MNKVLGQSVQSSKCRLCSPQLGHSSNTSHCTNWTTRGHCTSSCKGKEWSKYVRLNLYHADQLNIPMNMHIFQQGVTYDSSNHRSAKFAHTEYIQRPVLPPPWFCIRMFLWSYVQKILLLLLLLSSQRLLASMGRGLFALLLLPAVHFLCSSQMLPLNCISQLYSSTVFLLWCFCHPCLSCTPLPLLPLLLFKLCCSMAFP